MCEVPSEDLLDSLMLQISTDMISEEKGALNEKKGVYAYCKEDGEICVHENQPTNDVPVIMESESIKELEENACTEISSFNSELLKSKLPCVKENEISINPEPSDPPESEIDPSMPEGKENFTENHPLLPCESQLPTVEPEGSLELSEPEDLIVNLIEPMEITNGSNISKSVETKNSNKFNKKDELVTQSIPEVSENSELSEANLITGANGVIEGNKLQGLSGSEGKDKSCDTPEAASETSLEEKLSKFSVSMDVDCQIINPIADWSEKHTVSEMETEESLLKGSNNEGDLANDVAPDYSVACAVRKPNFECLGCHKEFSIARFLKQHLDRVTSQCKYDCKGCKCIVTFNNVCQLKHHLKMHGNRPLVISRLHLSMPSLPSFVNHFMIDFQQPNNENYNKMSESANNGKIARLVECPQCSDMVTSITEHLTERAEGMSFSTELWCSICKLLLPTQCAMDIHKRIHSKKSPYVCPECGKKFVTWTFFDKHLLSECFHYYRCLRLRCLICGEVVNSGTEGDQIHVRLLNHINENHVVDVFKCLICNALFKMHRDVFPHMEATHKPELVSKLKGVQCTYSQCPLCPGTTLVQSKKLRLHLPKHFTDTSHRIYGFYCDECKMFTGVKDRFLKHLESKHPKVKNRISQKQQIPTNSRKRSGILTFSAPNKLKLLATSENAHKNISINASSNDHSSSSKKLQKVKQSCLIKEPAESPCNSIAESVEKTDSEKEISMLSLNVSSAKDIKYLKCQLCNFIFQENILECHFEKYHKISCTSSSFYMNYVIEVKGPSNGKIWKYNKNKKIVVPVKSVVSHEKKEKVVELEPSKKPKRPLGCTSCDYIGNSKEILKEHFLTHRTPDSWQCMECGKCFCTEGSLEIHLLTSHEILEPKKYVETNNVHTSKDPVPENLKENQCSVCLLELPDSSSLHSHFRKHGLAFLKKINQSSKKS